MVGVRQRGGLEERRHRSDTIFSSGAIKEKESLYTPWRRLGGEEV
jgi:hypothetical protein